MMAHLTKRQGEILQFIVDILDEYGIPPSRREIAEAFGFKSDNAAECHLRALADKGVIELMSGTSRGIKILQAKHDGLPVVGQVAAGSPILAEECIEAHYRIDDALFYPRADYLLRVRGQSMKGAGILDGDLVAVHRTVDVSSGQIVVARMGDDVTVKRFRRRGNKVRLMSENPRFSPIEIDLAHDSLVIEGLVVGVIRNSMPGDRPRLV